MRLITEVCVFKKILCLSTLTVIAISGYSQLIANFTSQIQQGCGPLSVKFTDASTGNVTKWLWDLGNGAISTDQNPGAIYINPGKYTITLTVTDTISGAQNTIIKTAFITVYANPSVSFNATPLEGCAPLDISFTDKSIPGSGTITSWIWDFGDGITSGFRNPVHTYTVSDTFNVTLTVTNSFGCRQTFQNKNLIKIGGLVKAGFTYSYTNVCKPPSTVTFTNTSSSNKALNYQWYFGDGTGNNTTNPTHVYKTGGNFTVKLIASNQDGCSDVYIQVISIGSAKAGFSYTNACINEPVLFTDASSPKPITETWDFGDSTTQNGDVVSHLYSSGNTFLVTLTANFGNCTDVFKKTIITGQKPVAGFTVTGNKETCTYPVTLQFNNVTTGAVQYEWMFGDGTSSDSSNPVHTYSVAGKYSVTLIAFNASGCSDTLVRDDVIQLGPPKIFGIDSIPFIGCAPQTVTFNPDLFAPDPITSYKWTFGDGTTSTDPIPKHTYSTVGTYTVTLAIATAKGCGDSITIINAVSVGKKPSAKFAANPLVSCAGNTIHFSDSSKGNITDWQWFFGDGGNSSEQNPKYFYTDTGRFSVTLIVSEYGCYDTIVRPDYVYLKPPVARYNYSYQCSDPLTYNFRDSSISPKTWLWKFGDSATSDSPNVKHTYIDTGTYYVSLKVTNGGCSYVNTDTLHIINEHPSFTFKSLKSNFCKYDSIKFFATNYQPVNIKTFYWNFGDSTSAGFNTHFDTVYHSYAFSGSYKPYLVVKDINLCLDTISKKIQLNINGPAAGFYNLNSGCTNDNIIFTDSSYSDGSHAIKKWIWDFGDGSPPDTLSASPFTHTYVQTGYYTVSLKVVDSLGCYDSAANANAINITHPVAYFDVDTLSCTGNVLQFSDSSTGILKLYNWNFGDGNFSSDANPKHAYNAQGLYNIKLIVVDKNNCTDTLTKPAFIKVVDPLAAFIIPDSLFTCPPAFLQPLDSSKNYKLLTWDFGDDNTSNELKPIHYYTTAGNYVLTLTAQGYGTSCKSTVTKNIVIKGPKATLNYGPFSGCNPLSASFSASAKNTVSYIWDFGDGATQTSTDSTQQYIYTSTGKFLPQLIVVDSGGCRVPVVNADTVLVYGADAKFSVTQNLTGCDSLKINFVDSSTALLDKIKAYNWKFGDGDSSGLTDPSHTYLQSGLYNPKLIVMTEKGCVSDYILPLNINIVTKPLVDVAVPDSACIFSAITLNAILNNITPDIQWQWYLGSGDSASVQNLIYMYKSAGKFDIKLIASSFTGCADTIRKSITINPLPVTDAGIDTVICLGKSIALSSSGAESYNWSTNASLSCIDCSNPFAQPLQTTIYHVSGKSKYGCLASDSVTVQVVQPAKIILINNDSICVGNIVHLSASGADVYTWQPVNLVSPATGTQTTSFPNATTAYTVIGSDIRRCFSDTITTTVHVFPYPQIQIPDSFVTIQGGTDYTINAAGSDDIVSWQWTPVNWLSCNNCPQPVSSAKATITYTVKVQNITGCTSEKNITITVLCKDQNLYMPNTFSPNNDGMNDYFYPRGKGFTVKEFRIFNRWGSLVYEQHNFVPDNQSYGWNGTYKGDVLQPDVYVYIIDVLCDNGNTITSKGNVTLLH